MFRRLAVVIAFVVVVVILGENFVLSKLGIINNNNSFFLSVAVFFLIDDFVGTIASVISSVFLSFILSVGRNGLEVIETGILVQTVRRRKGEGIAKGNKRTTW